MLQDEYQVSGPCRSVLRRNEASVCRAARPPPGLSLDSWLVLGVDSLSPNAASGLRSLLSLLAAINSFRDVFGNQVGGGGLVHFGGTDWLVALS